VRVVGVVGVVGVVRSGCARNEDIFLSEVRSGGKVGVEKRKMDVHLNQFWCARLGATFRLKKKLNFSKIRGEREFRACWRNGRYYATEPSTTPQVLNSLVVGT
jgi:hypothetical protein